VTSKPLAIVGLVIAVAAATGWLLWGRPSGSSPPHPSPATQASSGQRPDHAGAQLALGTVDAGAADAGELEPPSAEDTPPYPVDEPWLRARLPATNRYWTEAAPTADVEVAKARAERAKRSNTMYGRILANEASEAEIRSYYDDKRQLSEDLLALAELVLREKKDELPERDLGLFELTANLHRARLQQIQRDLKDALGRLPSSGGAP
jgi:hypothetical protein